ncbi:hypothetical protein BDZ85DRAFT_278059 [Elsinoe ampelina]|uniref:Short-chain dehydrogenase n=1 Tax=Elsinoe ampelina TaxID=302913 RepID=A0A6A6GR36_9PEZI|nr:hypothetical protein BDZ85DRAFT_278059 [Elsinoe ampelina]
MTTEQDLPPRTVSWHPWQFLATSRNINVVRAFLSNSADPAVKRTIHDVSTNASHVLYPFLSLYGATKGAFSSWLRHVAQEHQDKGVRVHSFNPGTVLTDPARDAGLDEGSLDWDDVSLPAGLAVWLASEQGAFLQGSFVMNSWDVGELEGLKGAFERDEGLGRVVLKVQ